MHNKTNTSTFCKSRVKYPNLEKALNIWINQLVASGLPVSESLLYEKACNFATAINISEEDMKFSNGWLDGFKQRYKLKVHRIHSEANNTPLELLPNIIESNQTLLFGSVFGKKKDKNRLTVMLTANSMGSEKLKPMAIGKSSNPCCFKKIKSHVALPVTYKDNEK
ncbi:35784_t:CDS:2, partial [Gigaspora margarita]